MKPNYINHKYLDFKIFKIIGVLFVAAGGLSFCTHHVMIEPSDKPFVVNLNVKIDHEVRLQIKEQNEDLLNLEEEVLEDSKS